MVVLVRKVIKKNIRELPIELSTKSLKEGCGFDPSFKKLSIKSSLACVHRNLI